MKTILITAYAVNPYKGSEEGTGWNLICQVAGNNRVIAVTRKNNKEDIVKYMKANAEMSTLFERIEFLHFDLPKWMIWWKKGPLLSALYFYIWQCTAAFWLRKKNLSFDIAHSLNFHSNWTPSFLWILGKPFVWGPVGNHPLIPQQYILPVYGTKAWAKDRMLGAVKWIFWNLDPFVYICKRKAVKVFCVNTQAGEKLRLPKEKIVFMPAVASEKPLEKRIPNNQQFTVLSVGRFVPLKGFDLTIRSFARFYKKLNEQDQAKVNLLIIGTGPEKILLKKMIADEELAMSIIIKEWMPRADVIKQFSRSSVYLFPSHEGAGMVVAEALSYDMPVVCLDNYGPGEYVHSASRLKVKETDYNGTVEHLAEALMRLFQDNNFYNEESILAGEQFEKLFQWKVKGQLFAEVYEAIGSKKGTVKIYKTLKPATYE